MWPDNETSTDLVGFKVHADLIRGVVTNPAMLPVTVGVFGDWGGGKTSIMRMLERSLDPSSWPEDSVERKQCESIAVVYVNTWQFEGYDDAKSALLSSVLLQFKDHKKFGAKASDGVVKLLRAVNWGRFARLTLRHVAVPAAAAFMTGGAAAVPLGVTASLTLSNLLSRREGGTSGAPTEAELVDLWKGMAPDPELDIKSFRRQFAELLESAGVATLVVLIDDLDRCTPERIIENLEAVKLFLSVERTAFVIGADRRIVEHAIRSRYAVRATDATDKEEADRLVRDYLEKVVQVPYTLPRLSSSEIETYMSLLFCQRHLEPSEAQLCLTSSERERTDNRYGAFGYGGVRAALGREPAGDLADALVLSAAAAPLIAEGLKGNPRQVKRFLNALLLRRELALVAGLSKSVRTDVLVKLMVLEYVEPDRFTELFGDLGRSDGRSALLRRLEEGLPPTSVKDEPIPQLWATTWMQRWLSMDPKLTDVDLRDYFWIARDRLESFQGVTMVSPVVRSVLADLLSGQAPKRNSAAATAAKLNADELGVLYGLVGQHVTSKPDDVASWEPLRVLADALVGGAAENLASILVQQPTASLPAALGMIVVNLHNSRPHLRAALRPAIEHLRNASSTKVGKAIQRAELKA